MVIVEKQELLVIDEILEVLKNGEWHGLVEVSEKAKLQEFKVELVLNLLAEYGFLDYDKKEGKVKLSPQLSIFLKKIGELEREEASSVTGEKRGSGFSCID